MPSIATKAADDPPVPDRWQQDLAELRAELDCIDDALHDLLMRRAEVVERVGLVKPDRGLAFRPGRQAAILRRRLARHRGALPAQGIVAIWLELLSATIAMQTSFTVAVCEAGATYAFTQLAREQFGALVPVHTFHDPVQALADVRSGRAAVAVLPLPSDTETWWTGLLGRNEPRLHVVALVPFWRPRPEGVPAVQALVAASVAPDPSGDDRTLIGLECDPGVSRARIEASLAAAGLGSVELLVCGSEGALAKVPGFVAEDDPRLADIAAVLRPPVVLGAYAVPVGASA